MNFVLQLQPADETDNVISFNPSRRSRRSDAANARRSARRPGRARALAIALAIGALIGALLALSAADSGSLDLTGDDVETEAVAR